MRVIVYPGPGQFLHDAQAYLEAHEVEANLILGLSLRLLQLTVPPKRTPFYAAVFDGERIALAALMTPPYGISVFGIGTPSTEAAALLAATLREQEWPVSGAVGPSAHAKAFVTAWAEISGDAYHVHANQRVYALRQVRPPRYSPGSLRLAVESDAELIARWTLDFNRDAMVREQLEDPIGTARRRIAAGEFYLWEDGQPVSMAASTRPTPHGISVGMVYTPAEFRWRGYATSCVAALSQRLLDSGRQYCTLFTDLANPTSNDIYQQIGYEPVCDYDNYAFDAAG